MLVSCPSCEMGTLDWELRGAVVPYSCLHLLGVDLSSGQTTVGKGGRGSWLKWCRLLMLLLSFRLIIFLAFWIIFREFTELCFIVLQVWFLRVRSTSKELFTLPFWKWNQLFVSVLLCYIVITWKFCSFFFSLICFIRNALSSIMDINTHNQGSIKQNIFLRLGWRRKWQPIPVFLPGESHGQRSLVGCSPWGRTESDTTEATWQAARLGHVVSNSQ